MTMQRADGLEEELFLGRYRLQAKDGRDGAPHRLSGPIAEVMRAQDTHSGGDVAIKRFLPQYSSDPRFALRFREQLKAFARLRHPSLVTIVDYGWDGASFYIVNEWVEGLNLSTYLAEYGALAPATTVHVARRLCAALEAIHGEGLVHRGLKADNVFLTTEGGVKVADAGLSLLASDSGLSRTTVMLGAVNTMSPEQIRGKQIGPQSDIYSLGALLFAMLSGRFPFEGGDAWSVVRKHIQEPAPSLAAHDLDAPPALAAVVEKALQKAPEDRFATADEMDAALAPLPQNDALLWLLSPEHAGNRAQGGLRARFGGAKDLLQRTGPRAAWLQALSARGSGRLGALRERLAAWLPGDRGPALGRLLLVQFLVVFAMAFLLLYALSGRLLRDDQGDGAPLPGGAVNADIYKVAPGGAATPTLAPTVVFATGPQEPTAEATATAAPQPSGGAVTGGNAAPGGQNGGNPSSGGGSASGGGPPPHANGPPPHAGPPGGPPGLSGNKPGRGNGRP